MKTINFRSMMVAAVVLMGFMEVRAQVQPPIQFFRPYDRRGVGMYEAPKSGADTIPFDGLKIRFGANFTQGYQNLSHSNSTRAIISNAGGTFYETGVGTGIFNNKLDGTGTTTLNNVVPDANVYGGYITNGAPYTTYSNSNALYQMAGGFPLAMANFNIDVQLADGVRVSLISYMSSHHHNEFWVKGGYFQIDKVGFMGSEFLNNLWKNLTLKVGHMEINYGDAHFRRSDGGNAFYNPFIENNIMDAFTTEIGGELYWQKNGILAMVGVTDGEIQGSVSKPDDRRPSVYGKLGVDKKFGDNNRFRLTGSFYTTGSSISNTLYGGDRTGSNYQYVMEPLTASLTGNAFSGRYNPGFKDNITSFMINPFVKFGGLEFFGTYETTSGNSQVENGEVKYSNPTFTYQNLDPTQAGVATPYVMPTRSFTQVAGDVIYRFGKNANYFVGVKYNKVSGTAVFNQKTTTTATNGIYPGDRKDVSIDRFCVGAGWYLTRNVMFKAEYVTQNYNNFPLESILSGGKFNGLVIQGTIAF